MRRHLLLSLTIFGSAVSFGGWLLARLEAIPLFEGVVLAFWTVSTLGFGDGPATRAGAVVVMAVFSLAVLGYFVLLVAAFEAALERVETRRLSRVRLSSERDAARLLRELNHN